MPFPKKPQKNRFVYLDYAAATPLDQRVLSAMRPFLGWGFANPSGLSAASVRVRRAIDTARESLGSVMGTPPDMIIFTSGGTESCNLAILGTAVSSYGHIITTCIEHPAVLEPIRQLEKKGWTVTYLPVDEYGRVKVDDVQKAIQKNTVLVSIMYANNEIGTIQPIAEIGREILKWRKRHKTPYPYFHTDACQAAGYLDLFVDRLHVDLLSANGSKVYGPKGIGMLYKRRGVPIEPMISGGGQEFGLRSGTENVAGIIGLAEALKLVTKKQATALGGVPSAGGKTRNLKLGNLRDYFGREIQKKIPEIKFNGHPVDRLPNHLSVTFRGVEAEALVLYLDAYGIVAASGAACASVLDETSHVLRACGMSEKDARSTVRFTLGRQTKKEDIAYVMRYLPGVVKELRGLRDYSSRSKMRRLSSQMRRPLKKKIGTPEIVNTARKMPTPFEFRSIPTLRAV